LATPVHDLLQSIKSAIFPQRRAILKGGGELENIGDIMMRHEAEKLITSLGFTVVLRIGHGYNSADLSGIDNSIEAIFVLGSIQYSDAWAAPTLWERLEKSLRFHKHFPKAKIVFLPSTWGAFEPRHKDALARLVGGTRVLVRDKFSAESINGLLEFPLAEYCPDLAFNYPTASAAVAQSVLERTLDDPTKPLMGIIPNHRCIEKGVTPLLRPEEYIEFLVRSRDFALSRGFNVLGISHMLNTDRDLKLIRELGIPCVPADDHTLIRSLIANVSVCICSRYHGLVSCLSHGVPVLALGWHHKYRNLMSDMELGEYHLSVAESHRDPAPLLDQLFGHRHELRQTIVRNVHAARQLIRTGTESLKTP
jgi:colanic acid/amylovoran biosynthesis protein